MKRQTVLLGGLLVAAACGSDPGAVAPLQEAPAGSAGSAGSASAGTGGASGGASGAGGSDAGASGSGGTDAGAAGAGASGASGGAGAQGGAPGQGGASGTGGDGTTGGSGGASGAGGATGGAAGAGGSSGSGGAAVETCNPSQLAGLTVASSDLFHYPPYALDGCLLAYVTPVGTSGASELRLRDLASGTEQLIAPASDLPARPALAGALSGAPMVAWESGTSGKTAVRVWSAGVTKTLSGGFDHAGEPRATAGAVVFTGWLSADAQGDTDVFVFDLVQGSVTAVGKGPGQQRWADISATTVAFTDFSEDPSGVFNDTPTNAADLVLVDRASGAVTPHKLPGKQAFPLLGSDGAVVYLHWPPFHPEPKLAVYGIRAWVLSSPAPDLVVGDVTHGSYEVRPESRGGVVDWVDSGGGGLARFTLATATTVMVSGLGNMSLFAPVSTDTMTVLAGDGGGSPLGTALYAVPR